MRRFIKQIKGSIVGTIFHVIYTLLRWAIELFIIILAIIILTQRITNNEKSFLGYRIFTVATGSMEPEYVVGNILISKEKDPDEINVGDNIVYIGKESSYSGKIITHKVVRKEIGENGENLFYTKGIANTTEDPVVHEDQLYGTVVNNNIVLAWICGILTNKYGLYFVVVIPLTLWAFTWFVRVQGEKIEKEKELERKLREQKRANKKSKQEENAPVVESKNKDKKLEENLDKEVKKEKTEETIKTETTKKEKTEETIKTKTTKKEKAEDPIKTKPSKKEKTEN